MKTSTKKKAVEILDKVIEKCGGPGGRPGPCATSSAIDTNGKIAAQITGAKHISSYAETHGTRDFKVTSVFHDLLSKNPGKAAVKMHEYLNSDGGGASQVGTPKPTGLANWRISSTDSNGYRHHFTFHQKNS